MKKNKKFILFLDIDGVVNTFYWRTDYPDYEGQIKVDICMPSDGFVNNTQAICWLNELYRLHPYDIVVISTWNVGHTKKELADILHNSRLNEEIEVVDICKDDLHSPRFDLIYDYIKKNKVKKFLILDDDNDSYLSTLDKDKIDLLLDNFVQTNTEYGFMLPEFCKARNILETKKRGKKKKNDNKVK